MLKIITEALSLEKMFIFCGRICNLETPVPNKRATFSLIKVKSCTALLHVLLARIGTYLKPVLR